MKTVHKLMGPVQDIAPPIKAGNRPADPTGDAAIAKAAALAPVNTRGPLRAGSDPTSDNMLPPRKVK
jgi:hypothetical protein